MRRNKILVLCPYPENVAPSQRFKFEQFYPHFAAAGYDVKVSSFINKSFWEIVYKPGHYFAKFLFTVTAYFRRFFDLFRIPYYDIVYVHLWVTPFGPPLFERLTRLLSKKIIYDIDDLVYLKNITNKANPFISGIKGVNKPPYLMKVADHVITSTPYLNNFVKQFNNNTSDISAAINTDAYIPKQDYGIKDMLSIGWSGSHSTVRMLHSVDEVFQELARDYKFKLIVMGDPEFSLPGVQYEAIPWKEDYEVDVIKKFDIGVYPLPDEEWVLGKTGLKALQYMAVGVPTVATAIGTNFRIIENGVNGFLVNSKEEWKRALIQLMEKENLRREMGIKAAAVVKKNFSIEALTTSYMRIVDSLTSK